MSNLQKPRNNKKVRSSAPNHQMVLRQNPPDLCLDAIYRHIPLECLLLGSTELISKSWYLARTRALAKRQTLYLIRDKRENELTDFWNCIPYRDYVGRYIKREDGSPLICHEPWEKLKFDAVYFPQAGSLTVKFTTNLLSHLPKITHLAVVATTYGNATTVEVEQVIRLLEHHSAHLVKLHLSLSDHKEQTTPHSITRLFEAINRLKVLENLKLDIDFSVYHERPPLSILSRLTSFSLDSHQTLHYVRDHDWLASSLRDYADSSSLRSIGFAELEMEKIDQLNPQIVAKFKWLEVRDSQENAQMLQFFARFTSLTCLEFEFDYTTLSLNMLARCLAQVPSLVFLNLTILNLAEGDEDEDQLYWYHHGGGNYYGEEDDESDEDEPNEDEPNEDEPNEDEPNEDDPNEEEPNEDEPNEDEPNEDEPNEDEPDIRYQVPSVLELNLYISTSSHEDVEKLHIAETFPSLQVIKIVHQVMMCYSCGFKRKNITFEQNAKCRRLAKEAILAGCQNLHKII